MVTPTNIRLLPYRPHGQDAEFQRCDIKPARAEADGTVRLTLLQNRSARLQKTANALTRGAQTYTLIFRIGANRDAPVGALIDIYV